jgi:hypothetical protein
MQYYERSAAEVSGKPIEPSVLSPADVAGLYLLAPRVTVDDLGCPVCCKLNCLVTDSGKLS